MNESTVEWDITGMTCHTCSLNVKGLLEKEGMKEVQVSFANHQARFIASTNFNETELKVKLKGIGYGVIEASEDGHAPVDHSLRDLLIAVVFTTPLLLHMFLAFPILHNSYVQLALCLPVLWIGWRTFAKSAFQSVLNKSANMDVLVMMGSNAAFFYSCYGAFVIGDMNHQYFETAATIITFILIGEYIEHRSIHQTNNAVKELINLQSPFAKLYIIDLKTGDAKFEEIPTAQIMPGDRIQVNTGDSIATDGIVWSGDLVVDESMLTGESDWIKKTKGANVTGGTLVMNGSGVFKATATGNKTVLAGIIELVKKAQGDLPPIQKLADKIAAWFVPAVLVIAASTFLITYFGLHATFEKSLLQSIAVLVISCPCAMGLATPLAVMVGIGKSAQNGILFKGNSYMQQLAQSNVWIMDKTGTLTDSAIHLEEMNWGEEVRIILRSIEMHSSHPIAKRICAALEGTPIRPMLNIVETKGIGISAKDQQGNSYKVGKASLAGQEGSEQIYVFKNDLQLAAFQLKDELKPHAFELVNFCKSKNIKVVLLSGDKTDKCQAIAAKLKIEEVYAEQTPEQKIAIVNQFKISNKVVMIGDGINDAPALAAANVGISLSNATRAAIETAHVVLLKDDLRLVIKAYQLANATIRTIKQNLFWAFAYNIVAIPLAAFGGLSPMLSALSMAFSDIVLVINTLLLKIKLINRS
jgi:P-type Cu+ transporter